MAQLVFLNPKCCLPRVSGKSSAASEGSSMTRRAKCCIPIGTLSRCITHEQTHYENRDQNAAVHLQELQRFLSGCIRQNKGTGEKSLELHELHSCLRTSGLARLVSSARPQGRALPTGKSTTGSWQHISTSNVQRAHAKDLALAAKKKSTVTSTVASSQTTLPR